MTAPGVPTAIDALTDKDRFLIARCEEAMRDGLQLLHWMRQPDWSPSFFPIQLKKPFRLPYRNQGFFGGAVINGKRQSVMGTCQDVEFGSAPYADAAQLMSEFVLGHFLGLAHWTNPDGTEGGFTVEQDLLKKIDGGYQRFPRDSRRGCIDWRDLGRLYEWALVTIYVNDFALEFAGFRKRLRQALCAVLSKEFLHIQQAPAGEYQAQVSIAYPVVRYAPIPSYFGHAPGKFQTAVKSFSFFLTHRNEIKVRMEFASSPRCEKVLDIGKHWPDPIFGGAQLLHRLRLLKDPQPFHDYLEGKMLGVHCTIHQAFIEGVEAVWRDWAARNSSV